MKARHDSDGYELESPIPLPTLSRPGAEFSIVAADPENGFVTVERTDTEEYWQFPVEQVSGHTKVDYRFEFPKHKPVFAPAVKRVTGMVSKVAAASIAAFGGYHPQATAVHRSRIDHIQPHNQNPPDAQLH